MESSIAEFLKRKLACELLPTISFRDNALDIRNSTAVGIDDAVASPSSVRTHQAVHEQVLLSEYRSLETILAEGAIALSVTLSGGALFAS